MKDLIEIIKANPGCWAEIGDTWWSLYKRMPKLIGFSQTSIDAIWNDAFLANSSEQLVELPGVIYQADNCYGGSLLKALAAIQGVGLKSV